MEIEVTDYHWGGRSWSPPNRYTRENTSRRSWRSWGSPNTAWPRRWEFYADLLRRGVDGIISPEGADHVV